MTTTYSNRNHISLNRNIAKDMVRKFDRYLQEHLKESYQGLDIEAQKYLFFFTIKFSDSTAQALQGLRFADRVEAPSGFDRSAHFEDVAVRFNETNFIINCLNESLYGNGRRLKANWPNMPLSIVAIDFEGSRVAKEAPRICHDLHVHGVVAFPPADIENIQTVLTTFLDDLQMKHRLMADRFRISAYDPRKTPKEVPTGQGVQYMIEYAIKGAAMMLASDHHTAADYYRIYPHPDGETYSYPPPPKGSLDRLIPYEGDPVAEQHEMTTRSWLRAAKPREPAKKKKKIERLDQLPAYLRGLPHNRFGGHQTQRLRGLPGNTYGAAGPAKVYTREEIEQFERERGWKR